MNKEKNTIEGFEGCDSLSIGENLLIKSGSRINCKAVKIGNNVIIGSNVKITADSLEISDGAIIKDNNSIYSVKIKIGFKSTIDENSELKAINGRAEYFILGDYCYLGKNQTVLVPAFRIGDYTSIHKNALINGYKPCTLGHNCWVGQNSILNSTETLTIGNNVRIGTQSQIWTHAASGELLEGCTLFGADPVTIEDNVWIVGGAVVSPNLVLKNGSVIMVGSVLTKSTEPRRCYAGIPAKDVTDKIQVYKELSLKEKFEMMKGFIDEFHTSTEGIYKNKIILTDSLDNLAIDDEKILIITAKGEVKELGKGISVFSISTKNYIKKRTELEEKFIRFNLGYRARFIPIN